MRLLKLVLYFFLFTVFTSAEAFAQDGNQALEQLRMLQQKMATNQNSGTTNAPLPLTVAPTNVTPTSTTTITTTTTAASPLSARTVVSQPVPPNRPDPNNPQAAIKANSLANEVAEEDVVQEIAFDNVKQQLFPLKPDEVVRLKQAYHSNEYAQQSPVGTPPKPTATSQFVNLSPGSTPPVIRLSQGFVSSLVFLDSTGAPWPISAYDLGDPSSFNIQWDRTSNTLMIQSVKLYTYGNLAVRLRGLNTPVMLTLIPGQKAVDYRVDLRIQGIGPNAKSMPLEEGLPPSASDLLLNVLDGVPPPGSTRLTVSGGDARAWTLDDRMYVRTNLTILSPGWLASMTSADGMHAYEMQKSPVLLVSWHGKVMQLKVEGL